MSLIGSNHKEVIRIKAKRSLDSKNVEEKNMCVDPQITSFEMLYKLVGKAFNIQGDFVMSYLTHDHQSEDVYLTMLSDWDLDAAFFGASDPQLHLKIDVNPFEEQTDWELLSKQESASLERSAFTRVSEHTPRITAKFGNLKTQVNKKMFQVSKAIGLMGERQDPFCPGKTMMTDAEFRGFLDNVGHLVSPQLFRLSVYQGGIEPSLRKVAWRHLLNVYPQGMSGKERHEYLSRKIQEYQTMLTAWEARLDECPTIQYVHNTVLKDVLRTDRSHPFFAGTSDDRSENTDKLLRILVTYAVAHPEVSYCQGMSDLASPLLLVQDDEASTYICFCALMQRLRAKFSIDGMAMIAGFADLRLLLQHNDPDFYLYLKAVNAEELLFCYRWLILELKREFPLNDVLLLLEVMWSSLPPSPPDTELTLADEAYHQPDAWATLSASSPYITLQSRRRRAESDNASAEVKPCDDSPCEADQQHSQNQTNQSNEVHTINTSHDSRDPLPSLSKNTESQDENPQAIPASAFPTEQLSTSPSKGSSSSSHVKSALILGDDGITEQTVCICDDDKDDIDQKHPSIGFVNVDEKLTPLSRPEEFGQGNPFLMFLCLTILLSQRDIIIRHRLDYNEIAMLFDKMVRRHDVHKIVHQAKAMYASYLKQQAKLLENEEEKREGVNI